MKKLLFFISFTNAYYLFPFLSDQSEFLHKKRSIGPIEITKNYNFSKIKIYSDGYIELSENCKSISIFRLNQSISSEIYYSELVSFNDLNKYSQLVKIGQGIFVAKWGFRITWSNHLVNTLDDFNNFQMILLSNGQKSFVLLNYYEIKTNHEIFVGYTNNKCENIPFFEIVNSGFLENKSNANKRGFWVFQLENFFDFNSGLKLKQNYFYLIFYFIIFVKTF